MTLDPDDAGVTARALQRIALDVGVVLLVDPAARAEGRGADQLQQCVGDIHLWNVVRIERLTRLGGGPWPVVFGRFVAELLDREVRNDVALPFDAEAQVVGRDADGCEVELPFLEHRPGFGFLRRLEHHEHALLAFTQHHLVRCHRLFAHRHLVEVEHDPEVALGAHLDGRAGEPRRAHVLDGNHGAGLHQLEAGFEQALFGEGIADLDGRALLLDIVAEFGRRHRRAADPVPAGLGAEIDDGQADAFGFGVKDLVGIGEARGEGVDQDVAIVARVELDLTADGRHAERIAVAADARDDAGNEMARLFVFGRTEAQRVHRRNRPRPHREHVAQDAADAGRRALIGLDVAGVVVGLHLEHDRLPVADIDDAGILARTLNDARAGGGQRTQPLLGRFV